MNAPGDIDILRATCRELAAERDRWIDAHLELTKKTCEQERELQLWNRVAEQFCEHDYVGHLETLEAPAVAEGRPGTPWLDLVRVVNEAVEGRP